MDPTQTPRAVVDSNSPRPPLMVSQLVKELVMSCRVSGII